MKQGVLTLLLTSIPTSIRRLSDVSTHLLSSQSRKEGPRRPVAGSHWLICDDPTNNTRPPDATVCFMGETSFYIDSDYVEESFLECYFDRVQTTIALQDKEVLGTQLPVSQGRSECDLHRFPGASMCIPEFQKYPQL